MLGNSFSQEVFPNIQSKLPLAQLEAVSSHPTPCHLGEETGIHLTTTSFQLAVENVSSESKLETTYLAFHYFVGIFFSLNKKRASIHKMSCSF